MSASPEKLEKLRTLIGEMAGQRPKEFFPAEGLPLGIPRGALVEICGNLKTEWMIRFLKHNERLQTFWMEKEQSILPTAIQQRGVSLERVVFATVADLYPALRRVVQSQLFEVIVVPSVFEELRVLKALQLLAEKANTTIFLLGKKPQPAWPIAVQFEVNGPAAVPAPRRRSLELVGAAPAAPTEGSAALAAPPPALAPAVNQFQLNLFKHKPAGVS